MPTGFWQHGSPAQRPDTREADLTEAQEAEALASIIELAAGAHGSARPTGVIVVCGQKIALGRTHAGQTLTVAVSDTTLAIELDDAETRVVCRATTTPVHNIKADRPWTVPSVP
jgi:hypothetical protein